jgi:hypothetical protein
MFSCETPPQRLIPGTTSSAPLSAPAFSGSLSLALLQPCPCGEMLSVMCGAEARAVYQVLGRSASEAVTCDQLRRL